MGIEIERKFLLRGDGWRLGADRGRAIRQFYLAARDGVTVRLRILDEREARLTVKTGTGPARGEYEYEVPLADAREMEGARLGRVVEKRRHRVPLGALTVEVDVFADALAPLVLAEIELPALGHPFQPPPYLGREVTDDPRYANAALALAEMPPPSR